MLKINDITVRILLSLVIIVGLLYMPAPVFSQQDSNIQNLIVNGKFEEGFQSLGLAYGWGGFNNGQAAVGWSADTWEKVVPAGQIGAQMIEIKDAVEQNRYAGVYQTIPVVAGVQYKLTVKGLVRSSEGDIEVSNYGYRLQFGVNHNDNTSWELIPEEAWREFPWDEQPLHEPTGGAYRFDTFEATITAESDQLTLFIRGWKKWVDNGSGIFDIQEVSLVGPAPEGFESSMVQAETAAVAESVEQQPAPEQFSAPATTAEESESSETTPAETEPQPTIETKPPPASNPVDSQPKIEAPLPVSGQGQDDSINYVFIVSVSVLLILFAGAVTTTVRRRKQTEE